MKVSPIKSEVDYHATLAAIDRLMDARPNTSRGNRLDVVVTLVEAYVAKQWVIEPPDPINAIKLRMEQRGLTRRDLQRILGGRGQVSEILKPSPVAQHRDDAPSASRAGNSGGELPP